MGKGIALYLRICAELEVHHSHNSWRVRAQLGVLCVRSGGVRAWCADSLSGASAKIKVAKQNPQRAGCATFRTRVAKV